MAVQTLIAPSRTETHLTGEELYESGLGGRVELVEGEIVTLSPTGRMHGKVELKIAVALDRTVEKHAMGEVVVGEAGVYTGRNPDTVRGMDVAFISNERLAQTDTMGFLDVAPDLIVEVLSPHDRWSDVMEKLSEYFAIGVQVVWVADPRTQRIHVYSSPTESEILSVEDTLTGGDLLPDFSAAVAQLLAV